MPTIGQKVVTTKARRRKLRSNVPVVPIDGISFHSEDFVHKWKYVVVQRRIADEAIIYNQHRSCSVVFDLIFATGLMPTVSNVGSFYPKLVR